MQTTDEARETYFIFRRLSVTIQRFNDVAFAGTSTAPLPEFEQRLLDRRLHLSGYTCRPSFVDRGNQSGSPQCHDSLPLIANLPNYTNASRPPNTHPVHVSRSRDRPYHRALQRVQCSGLNFNPCIPV